MKKAIYTFIAALCLLTSCEKEQTLAERLVGDWHCTATSTDAEIYVTFTAEKTFVLYQKIGEGAYRVYNGIYELTAPAAEGATYTLSGQYNDGSPWGAEYSVESKDRNVLTLTAQGVSETYDRIDAGIPEEVLASCVTVVRSAGPDAVPFL